MKIEEIKIGDYVKVKDGIRAPDFEYQIMDDWKGAVIEIHKKEKLVDVEWDSETLLNTSEKYIRDLINEGYAYEILTLAVSQIEGVKRKNNSNQKIDFKSRWETKIYWIELYEDEYKSDKYIKLFQGIKFDNCSELYKRWDEYLNENLKFPIETEVIESEMGEIRYGAKLELLDIRDNNLKYGIIGVVKHKGITLNFPICNLVAVNLESKNYELLKDYSIWFANM